MTQPKNTCMVPDCEKAVSARGNCSGHYNKLRHLVNRSKGDDEPVTWERLTEAGFATTGRPGPPTSEFTAGVLATLAEHRKGKEPTS